MIYFTIYCHSQHLIKLNKKIAMHHKLAPSIYLCFSNTLTMCAKLNVDTIIDLNIVSQCCHNIVLMIIATFNFEHIVKML